MKRLLILLAVFLCFNESKVFAQAACCSDGVNLLANYNPDFSAPVTGSKPPGFYSDNNFFNNSAGVGNYSVIHSRAYGSCSGSPEFDHDLNTAAGQYLWYDSRANVSQANPGIAWEPYDPTKPLATQKLITVQPNTNYVFSAWFRDLARETGCTKMGPPVVGLRINGADLGSVDLGTIAGTCCPGWIPLCFVWNSGNSDTADIRVESRAGYDFTDLGIDDIFFGKSGTFKVDLGNDTTLCTGQSIVLKYPLSTATYLWSDNSFAPTLTVTKPGLYAVSVSQNLCTGTDSINVNYSVGPPAFSLGADTAICNGVSFKLRPNPKDTVIYKWQDNSSADSLIVNSAGTYSLTVSNNCGAVSDSRNVTVIALPTVALGRDTSFCDSLSFEIVATQTGQGNFQWSDGGSGPSITALKTGVYSVSYTNICGVASDNIKVSFYKTPIAPFNGFGFDVCLDSAVVLDALNPGMDYYWSTGETTETITALKAGQYSVAISDSGNCSITDYAQVNQHSCIVVCKPSVPNAFSPNNDGNNDDFKPLFNCPVGSYLLRVYNRWGQLIFESNDIEIGWNGTFNGAKEPVGTYSYYVQFKFQSIDKSQIVKGNVTLIR